MRETAPVLSPCRVRLRQERHATEEVSQEDAPDVPFMTTVDEGRRRRDPCLGERTDFPRRAGVRGERLRVDRVLPSPADPDRLTLERGRLLRRQRRVLRRQPRAHHPVVSKDFLVLDDEGIRQDPAHRQSGTRAVHAIAGTVAAVTTRTRMASSSESLCRTERIPHLSGRRRPSPRAWALTPLGGVPRTEGDACRADREMTLKAKAIILAFYNRAPPAQTRSCAPSTSGSWRDRRRTRSVPPEGSAGRRSSRVPCMRIRGLRGTGVLAAKPMRRTSSV
jgi:hypothetical protein